MVWGSLALFVLAAAQPALCLAGAWTRERGSSYQRVSMNYYNARNKFDNSGSRADLPMDGRFRDANMGYYMEYGLSDSLTAIGSSYYKSIEYKDSAVLRRTYGFSDIEVALRQLLHRTEASAVSLQGLVKIPEAYDKKDKLPLGNGQYDYEARVLYGTSLWKYFPGYTNLEVAYRYRSQAPADEIRYLLELGMDWGRSAFGRVKLDGIASMHNSNDGSDGGDNPGITPEFDLSKLDLALGYKLSPQWVVEIGYVPALYGKNTSAGATYTVAISFQKLGKQAGH